MWTLAQQCHESVYILLINCIMTPTQHTWYVQDPMQWMNTGLLGGITAIPEFQRNICSHTIPNTTMGREFLSHLLLKWFLPDVQKSINIGIAPWPQLCTRWSSRCHACSKWLKNAWTNISLLTPEDVDHGWVDVQVIWLGFQPLLDHRGPCTALVQTMWAQNYWLWTVRQLHSHVISIHVAHT